MKSLLLAILCVVAATVIVRLALAWRKKARRKAYLRNRDLRVRQQWADLKTQDDAKRSR